MLAMDSLAGGSDGIAATTSHLLQTGDLTSVGPEICTPYCRNGDRYSSGGNCRRCANQMREFGGALSCSREHDGVRCRGNLRHTRHCHEQATAVTALQGLQYGHEAND